MVTFEEVLKDHWKKEDLEHLEFLQGQIEYYKGRVNVRIFEKEIREELKHFIVLLKKHKKDLERKFRDEYGTDPVYSQRSDRSAGGPAGIKKQRS